VGPIRLEIKQKPLAAGLQGEQPQLHRLIPSLGKRSPILWGPCTIPAKTNGRVRKATAQLSSARAARQGKNFLLWLVARRIKLGIGRWDGLGGRGLPPQPRDVTGFWGP